MSQRTECTVHRGSNGQYKVTVPKSLGEAMELEGKCLQWRVASGTRLEAMVVDRND